MATNVEVPNWLKSLPLAPEYRPTDTDFSDPIAFISRIEREASAFGICKVIPPLPKPSRKFVFSNINSSLSSHSPDAPAAVFTTRHQELGSRKTRSSVHKQVWQSGEAYTLEQFEAKSKAFARARLGAAAKDATPLDVEACFWKTVAEKPIYVEYANDVPGSGFGVPQEPFRRRSHQKRRRKQKLGRERLEKDLKVSCSGSEAEGTAGWKLSNSPWNLQVIARSLGSLTRFMPDEVPGVTSPMVYIGMLFSWFAWHVEDHELHSLNFLHTGSPKTWYSVPGDYASSLEDVVRMQGYNGDLDRLAAFVMLGEKRTLFSPEVLIEAGIPCCRLVQNPGEFVVTFPRAYHVGFSHGFNCGEAANFATSKWLKVAKEAAVRRAAMSYLPMLSHQQLLYMLAVSFIARVPRAFLPGGRSSRLGDRRKEEREKMVKRAFLDDIANELNLLGLLLEKESTLHAVFWDPDMLPSMCDEGAIVPPSTSVHEPSELEADSCKMEGPEFDREDKRLSNCGNDNNLLEEGLVNSEFELKDNNMNFSEEDILDRLYVEDDDLPCGLDVDAGTLVCVACGILGYPFMAVIRPSAALTDFIIVDETSSSSLLAKAIRESSSRGDFALTNPQHMSSDMKVDNPTTSEVCELGATSDHHISMEVSNPCDCSDKDEEDENCVDASDALKQRSDDTAAKERVGGSTIKWNKSDKLLRPRIFCLEHALEVQGFLQCRGGSSILVICHSDYLKIKAQAMAVSEEFGGDFFHSDIPMGTASEEELNLINISIDDDHGEDWTSNLDLNLRHCVELRKRSSCKQEKLSLALSGLFPDPPPLSVGSGLSWHSKRSRSRTKMLNKCKLQEHSFKQQMKNNETLEKELTNVDLEAECCDMAKPIKHCTGDRKVTVEMSQRKNAIAAETIGFITERSGGYTPWPCTNMKIMKLKDNTEKLPSIAVGTMGNTTTQEEGLEMLANGVSTKDARLTLDHSNDEAHISTLPDHQLEMNVAGIEIGINVFTDESALSTSLCPVIEKTDTKSEFELLQDVLVEGIEAGANILGNEPTNCANIVSNSEIVKDIQTVPTMEKQFLSSTRHTRPETNQEKSEVDSTFANSESSKQIFRLMPPADSTMLQVNYITKVDAEGQSPANPQSIKCYARRKRSSDKACSTSLSFDKVQSKPVRNLVGSSEYQETKPITTEVTPPEGGDGAQQREAGDLNATRVKPSAKRKPEISQSTNMDCLGEFVRSPCEGLRVRTSRTSHEMHEEEKSIPERALKKANVVKEHLKHEGAYGCDLEGCRMRFRTKEELSLHKRNCCTQEDCRKRFRSHRYLVRHQCVHADDRPLKCPWEGCSMSFKWAWARTEHIRVHTGERPYECKVVGCQLTFRFVSDFSRHRRKTGHMYIYPSKQPLF